MKPTTKIESEWNAICSDTSLSTRERHARLLAIETDRRPGGPEIRARQARLSAKRLEITARVAAKPTATPEEIRQAVEHYNRWGGDCVLNLRALTYINFAPLRRKRREERVARERRLQELLAQEHAQGHVRRCFDHPLESTVAIVGLDKIEPGYSARLETGPGMGFGYFNLTVACVGGWFVRASESVDREWNAYSKAWHRSYGPKITVTGRTVWIRRYNEETKSVEVRDVEVASWRGNWLFEALLKAGVARAHKVPVRLRPVQLHPVFEVRPVRTLGEVALYERTLAGDHHDYCVLWHGLTYHAESPRAAVAGLRAKLAEAERRKNAPIDFALCLSLGFCKEGIKQFCRDFELDPTSRYTADEIRQAVERDLEQASSYRVELAKVADAVGYKIPEHLK
jgi:hypothetical protein